MDWTAFFPVFAGVAVGWTVGHVMGALRGYDAGFDAGVHFANERLKDRLYVLDKCSGGKLIELLDMYGGRHES